MTSPLNTKQHVLGATGALAHVDECQDLLNETLSRHNLLEHFEFLAGFDESFIEEGMGLLEMVYAVSDVEISDGEAICNSLGRVFSPYPGLIITPTNSYVTPVFISGDEDEEWDIYDLVENRTKLFKDCQSVPQELLLGSSYNPDGYNADFTISAGRDSEQSTGDDENSNRGREERTPTGTGPGHNHDYRNDSDTGDKPEDSDMDSDSDPEPVKVADLDIPLSATFNCPAKVNSRRVAEGEELLEFQTRGHIECKNERSRSGRRISNIKFSELSTTCLQPAGPSYQQTVARVFFKLAKKTWTRNLHPYSTLAGGMNVTETKAGKKGWGVIGTATGGWLDLHPNLSVVVADTNHREETTSQTSTRDNSRIIFYQGKDYLDWIFHIDDYHQRQRGLQLDAERLPRMQLHFRTTRPPSHIEFAIQSFWTFVPAPPGSGRKLVEKHPTPLANLLVWLEIEMPSDLSKNTFPKPECATRSEATNAVNSNDSEITKESGPSLLSGVSEDC